MGALLSIPLMAVPSVGTVCRLPISMVQLITNARVAALIRRYMLRRGDMFYGV